MPAFTRKRDYVVAAILVALILYFFVKYFRVRYGMPPETLPTPPFVSPVPSPSAPSPTSQSTIDSDTPLGVGWDAFRVKFGEGLQARFTREGLLASVRGDVRSARRASKDFTPDDPQKSIARAREILDAAKGLMGYDADFPLEQPVAKGDEHSAQVIFRQTKDGAMLLPRGDVTIELGPRGELLGFYSNYVGKIRVVNKVKISVDEARQRLFTAVSNEAHGGIRTEGGNKILWVKSSDGYQGRYAYEFLVQGRQVVVDAETGKILFRRDRRQFHRPSS